MTHLPDTPKVLYCFPDEAGEPFMPSNGTEGMVFTMEFCDRCQNQHPDPDKKPQCFEILMKSLLGEQPPEWVYSSEGWPICTAWKKWDWGNEDGGWKEPPEPEPEDPNQLLIPFDITDLFGFDDPEICVTRKAIFERELIYT